jgi:surface polysaccharide O-acyltransferase-like enzyme
MVYMAKYVIPTGPSLAMSMTLLAFLVFRFFGNLPSLASSQLGRIVSTVAPLTFGIYLCHHLVYQPVMETLALGTCKSWMIVLCIIPALTLFFYIVSAGMVYGLRQNRYLKLFLAP